MKNVVAWLFRLTGKEPEEARPPLSEETPFRKGIGYSQFNELLLMLGYDRVSPGFFKYVFDCEDSIETFAEFRSGIERFSKKAMLQYGNFKYAYKQFAQAGYDDLQRAFCDLEPLPLERFKGRHKPLVEIKEDPSIGDLLPRVSHPRKNQKGLSVGFDGPGKGGSGRTLKATRRGRGNGQLQS